MAWYNVGTVTATLSSATITGAGTTFISNIRVGDGITIAGSTSLHEVTNIISETQLTISPVYPGTTGGGKSYGVVPVQGYTKDLADQVKSLILSYSTLATDDGINALAALAGTVNSFPYFTSPNTMALATLNPGARAGLAVAAATDTMTYYTGATTAASTPITAVARTLLDDADTATMRATLGLGDTASPRFNTITLAGGTLAELGRYIDLHYDTTAADYHARISMEGAAQVGIDSPNIMLRASGAAGSGVGILNASADSTYLFRDGRIDAVNYANNLWRNALYRGIGHIWYNSGGTQVQSVDANGNANILGSVTSNVGNLIATAGSVFSNQWFYSSYSGGHLCMSTGNGVEFHWNGGFYYRIDGNAWVLINASPSDKSVKHVEGGTTPEEAGEIIDKLAAKSVKFSYKQNAPLELPEGSRHGFIAQEVEEILPTLFKETGAPGGNEDSTLLTYNDDAPYQLISLLVKTVSELRERVANLEQRLA